MDLNNREKDHNSCFEDFVFAGSPLSCSNKHLVSWPFKALSWHRYFLSDSLPF